MLTKKHLLAASITLSGTLMIIGAFGPWFNVSTIFGGLSVSGTIIGFKGGSSGAYGAGWDVVGIALIAGGIGLLAIFQSRRWPMKLVAALGGLAVADCVHVMIRSASAITHSNQYAQASWGWGLIVALLASVGLTGSLVATTITLRRERGHAVVASTAAATSVMREKRPAVAAVPAVTKTFARREWMTRHRGVLIGLGGGIVLIAVALGAFVLARSTSKTSSPAVPQVTRGVPTPATVTQTVVARSVQADLPTARELVAIVEFSQGGRAAVREGRCSEAIANRTATLNRLAAFTGGSARIQRASEILKRAIEASLESDRAYAAGGDPSAINARANELKRLFVAQFNPIALQFGLPTFRAGDI